ncbi:MAG: GNAT family N-acetyltransferase, partial [Actinomycetota bacterium]|nr:GNAT family N-acetyltransferase [Actinomycetota bacterium]
FGAALLAGCVEHVAGAGGSELWCNARMAAVGFYRRAGFEVVSEEFDVPGIGAHVVMTKPMPG